MKLFIHTTQDHFSECGYRYFKNTYGFDPESVPDGHTVFIRDSSPSIKNDFCTIHGWIPISDTKIPVFQMPADLSGMGKPLLFFTDTLVTYPCAVETDDSIIVSLDLFYHMGFCVSGNLENVWKNNKAMRCNLITIPFVDYYAGIFFDMIRQLYTRLHLPLIHKSFWPEGKTCAVCLTHDVDEVKKTYQWVTYPLKLIKQGNFGNLIPQVRSLIEKLKGHEPYWTFDEIIRIEGSRGVKSSFYFLKETAEVRISDRRTWRHLGRRYNFNDEKVRDLFNGLNSGGWEVGLHGSFYSYLDPEKLLSEKAELERSLGNSVTGGRQHNLNLKIPETWLNQEKAGLFYDTTLGYNDCLGFRWGISFPFRPYYPEENRSLTLVEIPLAIEDLPYFRSKNPWNEFSTIFNQVELSHGVLTLLWHHSVFNENEFPGWASDYAKILDYVKKRNAWIGSARQVYDWWTRREKTTIDWNYDGTLLKISPYPKEEQQFIKIYFPGATKIKEVKNAMVIRCDQKSCEIKTAVLDKEECIEITFTDV